MGERKLATVRVVSKLSPIEGADKIELALVDGWEVVTQKGLYKEGDLAVYCEIDSFLPIEPEFEFLRKSSYKKFNDGSEGFRLKTIRLRGQVSQGLLIPLDEAISVIERRMLPVAGYEGFDLNNYVDSDVTEALGIVKWEPALPASLGGVAKGYFPPFIRKTDEERIQNLTKKYDSFKDHLFYVTEKLDGSSATFYLKDGEFGVCSRNLELKETEDNTFWKVARQLDLENKMKLFPYNVCLQGELIGEGIQKNPYKIKGQTVKFFNIFNIDTQEYLNYDEFSTNLRKLGLNSVPILKTFFKLPETVADVIALADGPSELNPDTAREGLVFRSMDRSISFKAISNEFLVHEK